MAPKIEPIRLEWRKFRRLSLISSELPKAERGPEWHQPPQNNALRYHWFAKGDPTLRVARAGKDRLELFDAQSDDAFGWLQLNADNEVVKWHAPFGDDISIEYVFGPFAQFGDIRMPKWGAQTEGDFRFENLEFELSDRPPPVSLDPPAQKQD